LEDDKPPSDAGDILGKADALLRRHSIAPPASGSETGGVPVLTDLVPEAPAAPQAPPSEPAEETISNAPAHEPPPVREPSSPGTDALAREVLANVMAQIEGRIAADLEQRVAERIEPQVKAAIVAALDDLRHELAGVIRDAIAGALERRK
jgi:hypothetical protein